MTSIGANDPQSVLPSGSRATPPKIAGVRIKELGNVLTRSGYLTEVFRIDWSEAGTNIRQINWTQLNPGAVTDWHSHSQQTDRIVGVNGAIKLALWDAREASSTNGAFDVMRIGAIRPIMVIVPPGVWHGLRNESGEPAGFINIIDQLYDHAKPDNRRLAALAQEIPDIL